MLDAGCSSQKMVNANQEVHNFTIYIIQHTLYKKKSLKSIAGCLLTNFSLAFICEFLCHL